MNQPRGGNQPQQMNQNVAMTKNQALTGVLGTLTDRRAELSAVLPPDLSFEAFHASVNQALRQNPDILDCEPRSLVNACVKAAYDGLRIDGREAAIVYDMLSPRGGGRKVKTARYMPMYQGLVQQVLRGGMVLAIEADVAFENDVFRVVGGTDRRIVHEPLLVGDRGNRIAVYSIATLPSGYKMSHYLLAADVLDIQKMSQSGWKDNAPAGVWARWPTEQWKKTVIRQHRKTLPVGLNTRIHDSEQNDEFPQFAAPQAHPQIGMQQQRPTRAAIEDRRGTESGTAMDFGGGFDQETGELVEQERSEDPREQQQAAQQQDRQEEGKREDPPAADVVLPADDAEWALWEDELSRQMRDAGSVEALDGVWAAAQPIYREANRERKNRLSDIVNDRNTDLVLGEDE